MVEYPRDTSVTIGEFTYIWEYLFNLVYADLTYLHRQVPALIPSLLIRGKCTREYSIESLWLVLTVEVVPVTTREEKLPPMDM